MILSQTLISSCGTVASWPFRNLRPAGHVILSVGRRDAGSLRVADCPGTAEEDVQEILCCLD